MKSSTIFVLLSATMATLVTAGGVHSVPVGSPDGVYAHTIDERGEPQATYLGPRKASSAAPSEKTKRDPTAISGVHSAKFIARRDQQYCDNNNNPNPKNINSIEKDSAINTVFNESFNGTTFGGIKSWVANTVVAFACDYGHGQTFNGQQWAQWQGDIDAYCGTDVGGGLGSAGVEE